MTEELKKALDTIASFRSDALGAQILPNEARFRESIPVFITTKAELPTRCYQELQDEFRHFGLYPIVLPPGAEIVNQQEFQPQVLAATVGEFILQYGGLEPPREWQCLLDGKRLPPHSRVEIVIESGKPPSV